MQIKLSIENGRLIVDLEDCDDQGPWVIATASIPCADIVAGAVSEDTPD